MRDKVQDSFCIGGRVSIEKMDGLVVADLGVRGFTCRRVLNCALERQWVFTEAKGRNLLHPLKMAEVSLGSVHVISIKIGESNNRPETQGTFEQHRGERAHDKSRREEKPRVVVEVRLEARVCFSWREAFSKSYFELSVENDAGKLFRTKLGIRIPFVLPGVRSIDDPEIGGEGV